jgi:hypothetical protein
LVQSSIVAGEAKMYGHVHALQVEVTVHGRKQLSAQVYSVSGRSSAP